MKKSLKTFLLVFGAIAASNSAFATKNIENPLYLPSAGEFYSKTGAGIMYKKADDTFAMQKKGKHGSVDFPVWRFTEDLGYGITEKLSVNGRFGWTQDDDANRKGMHRGRLGLMYRIFDDSVGFVWDVYADAYLSGLSAMKGSYDSEGFTYDNYSNGRWGVYGGTRFGKTWSRFTLAAFFEYLQTFGNHNNEIELKSFDLSAMGMGTIPASNLGFPKKISVNLKSVHEINFGINGFYQLSHRWSVGGGFEFNEHRDNGIKSIHTDLGSANPAIVQGLLEQTADMHEGWQEYIIKTVLAYQITDTTQLSWFSEYTFDRSHFNSQNGTDIKIETGIRANIKF